MILEFKHPQFFLPNPDLPFIKCSIKNIEYLIEVVALLFRCKTEQLWSRWSRERIVRKGRNTRLENPFRRDDLRLIREWLGELMVYSVSILESPKNGPKQSRFSFLIKGSHNKRSRFIWPMDILYLAGVRPIDSPGCRLNFFEVRFIGENSWARSHRSLSDDHFLLQIYLSTDGMECPALSWRCWQHLVGVNFFNHSKDIHIAASTMMLKLRWGVVLGATFVKKNLICEAKSDPYVPHGGRRSFSLEMT